MEKKALELVKKLEKIFFEQRNFEDLLSFMNEHTTLIGTGVNEICTNFDELISELVLDNSECSNAFSITKSWYKTQAISENACVVYGEIWAKAGNSKVADSHNRLSAVIINTGDGIKLIHVHMSSPDVDLENGELYAKKQTKFDKKALQLLVEKATKELNIRNHELEILTENIPGGVHRCKCDDALTMLTMNSGFISMFGYSKEELNDVFDNSFTNMIYKGDRENIKVTMKRQLLQSKMIELEYRVQCKNGNFIWVFDRASLVKNENGEDSFYCILIDITKRKEQQESLRLSLERHRVILDQTNDIIFEWDIKDDSLGFSTNYEKKFGYKPTIKYVTKAVLSNSHIHNDDIEKFAEIQNKVLSGTTYFESELRIKNIFDKYTWCLVRVTTQYDREKNPVKAIGVIVDIDEEKNKKNVLKELAECDSLTNLYNKSTTKIKIDNICNNNESNLSHALMIIDIDNFKFINDKYGHQCGDTLLINMSQSLKALFRTTDIIGRIGGDEFIIFMKNVDDIKTISEKANSIVHIFNSSPHGIFENISCSVGIALYPSNATDYMTLSRCADIALYKIKNENKSDYLFYDINMQETMPNSLIRTTIKEITENDNIVNEKLAHYAFRLLYNSTDTKTLINHILETVGNAYNVSRAYIFESSDDGLCSSNTFEWCNEGVSSEIDNLQNLSYEEDLNGYLSNFDENGVFYCQEIKTLPKNLYQVLYPQGIISILQCSICDKDNFMGFVGFDECRNNRYWTKEQINSLTLISNILSTFLVKIRLREQLEKARRKLK